MLDMIAAAAFAPLVAVTSKACADPAIVSATSTADGSASLNVFDVAIVVRNAGAGMQPASLLESVQVYQNGMKVDQKGISPLKPGASQMVHYRLHRASDAAPGTTHLRLVLVMHDAHGAAVTNCSTANDTFRLDV